VATSALQAAPVAFGENNPSHDFAPTLRKKSI